MMNYPQISSSDRVQRLDHPRGKVRMVLDTDTYNEVDDQFALAYALLSPEKLCIEAVYAAPFHGEMSTGPADGMEKSYQEILQILALLQTPAEKFAFRGATAYLDPARPMRTAVTDHLIQLALAGKKSILPTG